MRRLLSYCVFSSAIYKRAYNEKTDEKRTQSFF